MRTRGFWLNGLSALLFASATVFAKIAGNGAGDVSPLLITFFRFFFGFAAAAIMVKRSSAPLRPVRWGPVAGRMVFNTAAVICFFSGISLTTVTNANMLNMTYPVFVFLLVPLINRERVAPSGYIYLALTLTAVRLIAVPSFAQVNRGDLLALLSALLAGAAICWLREARKTERSWTVIFWLMGFGTVLNGILLPFFQITPLAALSNQQWMLLVLSGVAGVGGQVALTAGYRYIEASTGSLISSSRLLWATLFGVALLGDPLGLRSGAGLVLLAVSLIGLGKGWTRLYYRFKKKGAADGSTV